MRNRHRWMYQLTGMPGWMRLGFSPGWIGRSPWGLGPCAHYMMYGQWPLPQMDPWWSGGFDPTIPIPGFPRPGFPTPYDPWGASELTLEEEIDILKAEAEMLEDELFYTEQRIKELEGEDK